MALTAAAASWTAGISYDEAFWQAVVRRVLTGDLLYRDVIDHKGPLFYPFFLLIDWMPGAFVLWRGLAVGVLAGLLAHAARSLSIVRGTPERLASILAISVTSSVVVGSELHLTIELLTVVAIAWSLLIADESPEVAALLMVASWAVDPRTLLLGPALLIRIRSTKPDGLGRPTALLTIGLLTGIVLLAAFPWLRVCLIELGAAARFVSGIRPGWQLLIGVISLLPIIPLIAYTRARPDGSSVAFAIGSIAIALGSIAPFGHYWAYAALVPSLLRLEPRAPRLRFLLAAALVAVCPGLVIARTIQASIDQLRRLHQPVIEYIEQVTTPQSTVVVFSAHPYISAAFPSLTEGRSPAIPVLGWETSVRQLLLSEFKEDLDKADVLVVTGGLPIPPEVLGPEFLDPYEILLSASDSFPCETEFEAVTVYLRTGCGDG